MSYGEYAQSDYYLDIVLDDHQLGEPSLVQPLCIRVRDFVDSRFIRQNYSAENALAQFTPAVREDVDMVWLTTSLLAVVAETLQPERVSLWLRQEM